MIILIDLIANWPSQGKNKKSNEYIYTYWMS